MNWEQQQDNEERRRYEDEMLESDSEYEIWSKAYDEETLKEREDAH